MSSGGGTGIVDKSSKHSNYCSGEASKSFGGSPGIVNLESRHLSP